jgi:hypothetical protein
MSIVVKVDSGGMIYLPSSMKIDSGIQIILRLLQKKLRSAALVLQTGRFPEVLSWDGFMWHDMHTEFHED